MTGANETIRSRYNQPAPPAMKKVAIFLAALVGAASLPAQVLVTDDFSGASVDTETWTTILPAGSSSVVQSGGVVTTTGRGILATVDEISTPYVIEGVFTMWSDLEHFNVVTRTDLSESSSYERPGILVSFSNDGNEVSIQRYVSAADNSMLALSSYSFTTGQAYSFRITDTGSSISLAINDADQLSASSTFATGGHIAFYSREFSGTSTQIDSITVTAIPEPAPVGALVGGVALVGGIFIKRRRRIAENTH